MTIDVKQSLDTILEVGNVLVKLTKTRLDDDVFSLLTAIANDATVMAKLQDVVNDFGALPAGVMPQLRRKELDDLKPSFDESAALRSWSQARQKRAFGGTDALDIGGWTQLLSLLPTILQIITQIGSLFTKPKPTTA